MVGFYIILREQKVSQGFINPAVVDALFKQLLREEVA